MLGIAPNRTGKPLLILPILRNLIFSKVTSIAVGLVPTRELAVQVYENAVALAQYTDIRYKLIGGTGMQAQIKKLQQGVDLIAATPGRFMVYTLKERST